MPTISVDNEGANQLRALARFHNLPAGALVAKWVASEAKECGLDGPHIYAQAQIERVEGGLEATILFLEDGCETETSPCVTVDELEALAKSIMTVIDEGGDVGLTASGWVFHVTKTGLAITLSCFSPSRHGKVMRCPMSEKDARQIAEQFRAEIAATA